jgi:hypothetical protein
MKKKNLTTTFIQLLRTKTIKNKIKNKYNEKNHQKERKKKSTLFPLGRVLLRFKDYIYEGFSVKFAAYNCFPCWES